MGTEINIHPVQSKILMTLLFKKEARFSELNSASDLSSDHFNFHIKQLLDLGLLQKVKGKYSLTVKGKEFANRFDTDKAVVERQAKIGVAIIAVDTKKKKILIQQRLKQPYYGFHGCITGKVRWGETIYETAARELMEESGLTAEFRLAGIEHKLDYSPENNILEDKFFYVFKATNIRGKLVENFEGGKNLWIDEDKITDLPDTFPDVLQIIKMIKSKKLAYLEKKYTAVKY